MVDGIVLGPSLQQVVQTYQSNHSAGCLLANRGMEVWMVSDLDDEPVCMQEAILDAMAFNEALFGNQEFDVLFQVCLKMGRNHGIQLMFICGRSAIYTRLLMNMEKESESLLEWWDDSFLC